MKLDWILLGLVLGLLAALGIAVAVGEIPNGHGFTHPELPTLEQGGSGTARLVNLLWLGWLIGSLQIAFFVACLALGLRRGGRQPSWRWRLLLGGLAFELVWAILVATYWGYAKADSRALWLGLPIPTAIMLYGLWLVPVYFCVLYYVRFDRWVLSEGDLERFHEIVARAGRGSGSSGGGTG